MIVDQELGNALRDLAASGQETRRYIREVGKQLSGLGEKFGGFTEGMAFPSMKKILRQRFAMQRVSPNVTHSMNGRNIELDVLATSNEVEEVYIVEVKSHLKERGIEQMLRIMRAFPEFFPEHRGKKLFGILAAVQASREMRRRVVQEGLYFARVHDEAFEIDVPRGFQPKAFPL